MIRLVPAHRAQRGYQVHVFDRIADGLKPALVAALGATYHHGPASRVGISSSPYHRAVDMNRIGVSMVLANSVIFGTVSAARRHYELAVDALARADQAWLGALISQRIPLSAWPQALSRRPRDVKVVVDLTR